MVGRVEPGILRVSGGDLPVSTTIVALQSLGNQTVKQQIGSSDDIRSILDYPNTRHMRKEISVLESSHLSSSSHIIHRKSIHVRAKFKAKSQNSNKAQGINPSLHRKKYLH